MNALELWQILAIGFVGLSALLWYLQKRLSRRGDLLDVALELTSDFYTGADKLMQSPDVPESLKNTLYDVLLAVTDDSVGRIVHTVLTSPDRPNKAGPIAGTIAAALADLRGRNPALAEDYANIIKTGFGAILLSHADKSEHKVLVSVTRTATQPSVLVREAEKVAQKIGNDTHLDGCLAAA